MKINSELGYRPVTFSELTDDEAFWKGCQSCVNYDILMRTSRKHCLCTGMLYDPLGSSTKRKAMAPDEKEMSVYGRWLKFKQSVLLKLKKGNGVKNQKNRLSLHFWTNKSA
jgi:hypothetical protein